MDYSEFGIVETEGSKAINAIDEALANKSKGKIVGQKDTKGKPDLTLIPYKSLVAVSKVREFGNAKYGSKWAWRENTQKDDLVKAALRHILKYTDPNEGKIDDESGLNHLYHAAASLLMAIDLDK